VVPGEASTSLATPPWAAATSRTTDRPNPVPSARPVTKGSNKWSRIAPGGPEPSSLTARMRVSASRRAEIRMRLSAGEAAIALSTRLSIARRICSGSKLATPPDPRNAPGSSVWRVRVRRDQQCNNRGRRPEELVGTEECPARLRSAGVATARRAVRSVLLSSTVIDSCARRRQQARFPHAAASQL